ncbi:YesK family protein [Paenibacillus sp. NPDC055715]
MIQILSLIIIWVLIFMLLIISSYLLYRKNPNRKLMYLPPALLLSISILTFVFSFVVGKFEGMGLGALSIGTSLPSLLAFIVPVMLDYFVNKKEI